MKDRRVQFVTRTALFLALLVVFQFLSKPLGQFVTGSLVNLTLIIAVSVGGLASGSIVALVSPFLAFLLGIGPAFIQVIPAVALGNFVLVLVYGLLCKWSFKSQWIYWSSSVIAGAILKCAALYVGVVLVALPLVPGLNEKQAAMLSAMFSWPQLVTALVGGVIAALVVPVFKKYMKSGSGL